MFVVPWIETDWSGWQHPTGNNGMENRGLGHPGMSVGQISCRNCVTPEVLTPLVLFLGVIVQSPSLHEVHDHIFFPVASLHLLWISPDIFVCAQSTDLFSHPFSDLVIWSASDSAISLLFIQRCCLCCSARAVHDEWWLNSSNDLFLLWENAQWLVLTHVFCVCVGCGV